MLMHIFCIIRSVFPVFAVSDLFLLSITDLPSIFFHAPFLFGLFVDPEDDGDMFLRNADLLSRDYTHLYPRRQNSLIILIVELLLELPILYFW
jgi:hypothetical protein